MTMGANLGRYVMLRLRDTGHGTASRVSDKFFSPFPDRAEVGPKTTLGLIKSNGGFMSVYSNLERGTTCQIFLPAKVDEGCCILPREANGAN
jgi:two-component system, cell cycle sensor histidine kinase and response regulator CckA